MLTAPRPCLVVRSAHISRAGSLAIPVKLDTRPVDINCTPDLFKLQVRPGEGFFVLIGTSWRRSTRPYACYPPSAFISSLCIRALQ